MIHGRRWSEDTGDKHSQMIHGRRWSEDTGDKHSQMMHGRRWSEDTGDNIQSDDTDRSVFNQTTALRRARVLMSRRVVDSQWMTHGSLDGYDYKCNLLSLQTVFTIINTVQPLHLNVVKDSTVGMAIMQTTDSLLDQLFKGRVPDCLAEVTSLPSSPISHFDEAWRLDRVYWTLSAHRIVDLARLFNILFMSSHSVVVLRDIKAHIIYYDYIYYLLSQI